MKSLTQMRVWGSLGIDSHNPDTLGKHLPNSVLGGKTQWIFSSGASWRFLFEAQELSSSLDVLILPLSSEQGVTTEGHRGEVRSRFPSQARVNGHRLQPSGSKAQPQQVVEAGGQDQVTGQSS